MEKQELEELIHEYSKELIQFVQTTEFLEGANQRALTNPLLQGKYKKAWEYISGGTMQSLLMAYYQQAESLPITERKIETVSELFSFLIDCKKEAQGSDPWFMYSPTHAFLFYPSWMGENPEQSIARMKAFWNSIILDEESMEALVERFSNLLSDAQRVLFLHRQRLRASAPSIASFRELWPEGETLVDSFLYESLPLLKPEQCRELSPSTLSFDEKRYWTPKEFREKFKKSLLQRAEKPFGSVDVDEELMNVMRQKKLAPPMPVLFADTNWTAGCFGIGISPNGTLDLWRFHRTGARGAPMSEWFEHQRGGLWGWIRFQVT